MLRLISYIKAHRYVLGNFIARDLKVKYRGTVFGYLWSLLEPLSLVGVYWFLFVVLTKRGGSDYPLLVVLGLLPWLFFSQVVMGSAASLRSNAGLIRKVQLPREIYVVASAGSSLVVLLLSMLVVIPFLFIYDVTLGLSLILWPLGVLILGMLALGVGLIAAVTNVMYRDVSYVLGVLLRFGLYLSAAIYPISMVPETARYYFLFNPIALALTISRNSVLNRPMPFEIEHVVSASLVAFLSLLVGAAVFPRLDRKAVKFL